MLLQEVPGLINDLYHLTGNMAVFLGRGMGSWSRVTNLKLTSKGVTGPEKQGEIQSCRGEPRSKGGSNENTGTSQCSHFFLMWV